MPENVSVVLKRCPRFFGIHLSAWRNIGESERRTPPGPQIVGRFKKQQIVGKKKGKLRHVHARLLVPELLPGASDF
jgi:hypothetical protein